MGLAFVSNKKDLMNIIQPALAGAATRHNIPALEGLLFTLENTELTVCGDDMEKGIVTAGTVEERESGSVILNAKKIASIVKAMPDGDITFETDSQYRVKIKAGSNDFTLHGMDAASFPSIPAFKGERSFSINQSILAEMIESTNFAVSQSDARPILTGELFQVKKNDLTIVALDNYRMAIREEKGCVIDNEEAVSFVVPGTAVAELRRLLKDSDDLLQVELTAKYILFKGKDVTLFTRQLEGEYFDYRKAIPKEYSASVEIIRSEFQGAVSRASLMVDEKRKNPIICEFAGDELNITASSYDGSGKVSVGITKQGADMKIGFNHRYLLDALKACKDEEITVSLTSELGAAVIEPANKSYLYLVLPMKTRD